MCQDNVEDGSLIDEPVTDEAPRNACAAHPLCGHVFSRGGLCHKGAVDGSFYCHRHGDESRESKREVERVRHRGDGKCAGINRKRKRCGARGSAPSGGRWFCSAHMDQDSDADDVEVGDEDSDDADLNGGAVAASGAIEQAALQTYIVELRQGEVLRGSYAAPFMRCCGRLGEGTGDQCSTHGVTRKGPKPWYCAAHEIQAPWFVPVETVPLVVDSKESKISVECTDVEGESDSCALPISRSSSAKGAEESKGSSSDHENAAVDEGMRRLRHLSACNSCSLLLHCRSRPV